jgi:hypothetical protein
MARCVSLVIAQDKLDDGANVTMPALGPQHAKTILDIMVRD